MDKLRAMEAFVRIVEQGSLTAAANALNTSLPSMVRTLATLERELDVRLLNRTTRRIALTDEGREYYERCTRILAEVAQAEASLSARRVVPRGGLRVTAPVMFGARHLGPIAAGFSAKYPDVRLELVLLDRIVDLIEEGIDTAVRIGHLPDSSLVGIEVGRVRRVICASPGYLRRAGSPKTPVDLASHRCVTVTGMSPARDWTFRPGTSRPPATLLPVMTANQIEVLLEACVRGVGVGQFLSYQVDGLLEEGRLKRVLPDHEAEPVPIHVLYPQTRLLSSTTRAFVDWTLPRLRAVRALDGSVPHARPSKV